MRVYATMTTDRARKGEKLGGQDWMEIILYDEERRQKFVINYSPELLMVRSQEGTLLELETGERQKSDCPACGKPSHANPVRCRYYGGGVRGNET